MGSVRSFSAGAEGGNGNCCLAMRAFMLHWFVIFQSVIFSLSRCDPHESFLHRHVCLRFILCIIADYGDATNDKCRVIWGLSLFK